MVYMTVYSWCYTFEGFLKKSYPFILEREIEHKGEGQAEEREFQADSALSMELNTGLDFTILRS